MRLAFTARPGGSRVQVKKRHETISSRVLRLPKQTLPSGCTQTPALREMKVAVRSHQGNRAYNLCLKLHPVLLLSRTCAGKRRWARKKKGRSGTRSSFPVPRSSYMVQSARKESLPETLFPREDSGVLQTEAVLPRPEDPLKPEPRVPTSAPLPLLSRGAKSPSPAAHLLCCCYSNAFLLRGCHSQGAQRPPWAALGGRW